MVPEVMSAKTVRRAVFEGGIAAEIQLGYEISQAKSFTLSGDGTSHRHTNYESRHIALQTPTYTDSIGSTSTTAPKNRLVGVDSSVDHTSENQFAGWLTKFDGLSTTFNRSSLARRTESTLELEDFAVKAKGMAGDHATDQKKQYRIFKAWKDDTIRMMLAHKFLEKQPSQTLSDFLARSMDLTVMAAGGEAKWNELSHDEQVSLNLAKMKEEYLQLGEKRFGNLPAEEKRGFELFLWLGCCMHKDLNSVKGGNITMSGVWQKNGLTPPMLLANKDNAVTLRGISQPSTSAEIRAMDVSAHGGVKLASLAGAIFNHKDDKKGQQDTQLYYFRQIVGHTTIFPDTSNTRYQTYCAAAEELLVHRLEYVHFLKVIRDKKDKPGFNHMEQNVYDGLHDIPTLTELAVLALYSQAVTRPYMRVARIRQNGLKLGPLHAQLKMFVKLLIDDPELVLSSEATFHSGAMDQKEWDRPEAVAAVHELSSQLPYLKVAFVAFLEGALITWERFTEEFTPGGAIDQATSEELDEAWMFSTNDDNEGALGGLRLWKRRNPNGTQAYFNAQKKHDHNDTANFMTAMLTEEDHQHIRREARILDESKHEAIRRKQQVDHDIQVAAATAQQREEKEKKHKAKIATIKATPLIFADTELEKLKKTQLEAQLAVYRLNDPEVPLKSKVGKRENVLTELRKAIARYKAAEAAGNTSQAESSNTSEAEMCMGVDTDLETDSED
ncbi:hypothetical protein SCP_0104810 [Sparassis crispa]|uniref:Uncharacterized protein n=1 Tax=Sparassis crispa TaxID=139825 RepID=A0A401G607_9APHY|nr:hypothetical protein SCP_0104810 [Sparassis crispa]GBE77601.1 hypothetical protein SCP_0104810 [Sparassis crispa]